MKEKGQLGGGEAFLFGTCKKVKKLGREKVFGDGGGHILCVFVFVFASAFALANVFEVVFAFTFAFTRTLGILLEY